MEYEALLQSTGGFGRLQAVMVAAFGVLCFRAMAELQLFVLMQASPDYRCAQQNTSGYEAQDFGAHCSIRRLTPGNGSNDTATVEACHQFEYRPVYLERTLIEEYDLVCDRAGYSTVMTTLYFLGHCVGMLLSTLGDRVGRKTIFYGAGVLDVATTLLPAFMPNVWSQTLSRFLIGIPTPVYSQGLLLLHEFTMQQHRGLVGNFFWLFWCAGYMGSALLAYLLQDWRKIQLVSCVFCVSYPVIYALVPESPRWLVLRGRTADAKQVFQQLAKWNGVQWKPGDKMDVQVEAEPTGRMQEIFQRPQIRKKTLIIFWMMIVHSFCYYGLSIDSSFISEDIFVNTAISGALEVPSYLIAAPLCNKFGRRWPTIATTAVSGLCIAVSAFLPYGAAKMAVAVVGKTLLTSAYSIMSILAAELFPTSVRNSGMFLALLLSSLITTASPAIVSLGSVHEWLPGLLFGGAATASAALVSLLPETLGLPLPETVAHSESLVRGSEAAWLRQSQVEKLGQSGEDDATDSSETVESPAPAAAADAASTTRKATKTNAVGPME